MAGGACQPGDDTETCCLKEHPGAYDRCMGVAPRQPPRPLLPPSALPPRERTQRKELCQEFYARCIAAGGEDLDRGTYGHTHCQACYTECYRTGTWPQEFEDKPCPGSL